MQYLAVRIADQQQVIANLVTVDSEQRLGKTLLQLARHWEERPAQHRIEPRSRRRIVGDGGHDAASDQRVYAALS